MLQGITEDVKKQAKHRMNCRFFMYLAGIHSLALKNTRRGRFHEISAELQKTQESKRLLGFRAEAQW